MKYVVTGGAGFIGSNLVDSLIDKKNEVHIIDNFSSGKKQNCHPHAFIHEIDIAEDKNLDSIQNIFLNANAIFQCAAVARVQPSIQKLKNLFTVHHHLHMVQLINYHQSKLIQ